MFRFSQAVLAALLALAALPAAAQSVDPRFLQAMSICIDTYPDLSRARLEALRAGFRQEGKFNRLDFYSAYDRDLLIGLAPSLPGCLFGLDGLRDEAAIEAAQAALSQRFGDEAVRLGGAEDGYYIEGWVAPVSGGGLLVAVRRQENFRGMFRGSLIEVRPFPPQ